MQPPLQLHLECYENAADRCAINGSALWRRFCTRHRAVKCTAAAVACGELSANTRVAAQRRDLGRPRTVRKRIHFDGSLTCQPARCPKTPTTIITYGNVFSGELPKSAVGERWKIIIFSVTSAENKNENYTENRTYRRIWPKSMWCRLEVHILISIAMQLTTSSTVFRHVHWRDAIIPISRSYFVRDKAREGKKKTSPETQLFHLTNS